MTQRTNVALVVNGTPRSLDVPPGWRLLDLLREGLGLVGSKEGCDDGTCGTCVVMVDGKAVRACRTTATKAAGSQVLTIEGLGSVERPHALQQAFVAADAVQCGFCTPGMIMAAAALLERNPHPTRSEIGQLARQQPLSLHRVREHRGRDRVGSQRAAGLAARLAGAGGWRDAAAGGGRSLARGCAGQGHRPRALRGGSGGRWDAACPGSAQPARARGDHPYRYGARATAVWRAWRS